MVSQMTVGEAHRPITNTQETIVRASMIKFAQSEQGAVTLDWVVLTAAVLGISVAAIGTIADGALDQTSGLAAHLYDFELPEH